MINGAVIDIQILDFRFLSGRVSIKVLDVEAHDEYCQNNTHIKYNESNDLFSLHPVFSTSHYEGRMKLF